MVMKATRELLVGEIPVVEYLNTMTRVTRRVPIMMQELLTIPVHRS